MSRYLGDRAIVLGGGMAGLLAARVLADRYPRVLVLDRDALAGTADARRGVPQGRHAHALLARGQQILEQLFPGLLAELTASGVLSCDLAGSLRWYFHGRPLRQAQSGLLSVSATRPELEAHVRTRVAALPGVELRERTVIHGIVGDGGRITGVRASAADSEAEPETLRADLVVDATGRGSRAPAWLADLGYARPPEEKVKIDLAYTTRLFKLASDPYGTDLSINSVASPANPRGAFFAKLNDQVAMLSLTGMLGDHPPRDDEGFLDFAKSLSAPEIYETVKDSAPVDDAVTFRVPASVRRRYDRLSRFPEGFLVIGDAVCSFNPVYGQGMTVAAMEALVLSEHLRAGPPRPLAYFRELVPIVDVPWEISASGDLAFPGVSGKRTLKTRVGNAYIAKLHAAAHSDSRFTEAFFRVAGLVDPPQALMRPRLVAAVLRAARRAKD
ncbi:NAD(P)/FAD-dependent oxidoreductase [Amycolatopsis sp. GA6-003]|uniref:NAD(P)/FAD-dependent oxidoreductase n=1 Tax=Amycolatopsis sp. GA6-003 TaxID=2652444 RepID=UPI003916E32F